MEADLDITRGILVVGFAAMAALILYAVFGPDPTEPPAV